MESFLGRYKTAFLSDEQKSLCFFQVARLPQIRSLNQSLLLDIIEALAEDMGDGRLCPDMSTLSLTDYH